MPWVWRCGRWEATGASRYGYEPLLVETFVDAERFAGTCYQAANWELVGVTQGRGRQDTEHQSAQPVKKVWVYPLHAQARERLRGGAAAPTTPSPADWAEQEFGGAILGDERLKRRLLVLVRDFYARPSSSQHARYLSELVPDLRQGAVGTVDPHQTDRLQGSREDSTEPGSSLRGSLRTRRGRGIER